MAIALDSSANSGATSVSSLTFAHTCASGSILWVAFAKSDDGNTPTGVTYNGVAMTSQSSFREASLNFYIYIYKLLNPASGANNVVISLSGSTFTLRGSSVSFTGCDTSSQPNATSQNTTTGTSISTSTTSTVDNCLQVGFYVGAETTQGTAGTDTTKITGNGGGSANVGIFTKNAITTPAGSSTIQVNSSGSVGLGLYGIMVQPPQGEIFTISETLALTESISNLRTRLFSTSETITLTETISALKGIAFSIAEALGLVETFTATRTRLFTIAENTGLVEVMARIKLLWTNSTKENTTWTEQTKETTNWTNQNKN